MPTEKQLLNIAFDGGASDRERAAALDTIARTLHLSRDEAVTRYMFTVNSNAALAPQVVYRRPPEDERLFAEYANTIIRLTEQTTRASGILKTHVVAYSALQRELGEWQNKYHALELERDALKNTSEGWRNLIAGVKAAASLFFKVAIVVILVRYCAPR